MYLWTVAFHTIGKVWQLAVLVSGQIASSLSVSRLIFTSIINANQKTCDTRTKCQWSFNCRLNLPSYSKRNTLNSCSTGTSLAFLVLNKGFHLCTKFKHFLWNSLPFSEVIKTVTFHSPYLVIIQTKRKSEIFGYKDVTERGIRKILK